jgi:hypothetical protein
MKCIQKFIGKFLGKRPFGRLRSCVDNMKVKEGGRWHGIVPGCGLGINSSVGKDLLGYLELSPCSTLAL